MDWINFYIFMLTWVSIQQLNHAEEHRACSPLCDTIGYCDDSLVMNLVRNAKTYLSWCLCIQLLKVVKFTDTLVPKMDLATEVLYEKRDELLFFTFVFVISMLAFSQLFYVQLGPVMAQFNTQQGALISLVRSLFGDFDIDAILSNSRDYLNALLFLTYLFVAVFIMLSMFLAILGEAQVNVRERKRKEAEKAEREMRPMREYGVFSDAWRVARKANKAVRTRLDPTASAESEGASIEIGMESGALSPVRPMPTRPLPDRCYRFARRKDVSALGDKLTQELASNLLGEIRRLSYGGGGEGNGGGSGGGNGGSVFGGGGSGGDGGGGGGFGAAAAEERMAALLEARLVPRLLAELQPSAELQPRAPTLSLDTFTAPHPPGDVPPPSSCYASCCPSTSPYAATLPKAGQHALERAAAAAAENGRIIGRGTVHRRNPMRVNGGSKSSGTNDLLQTDSALPTPNDLNAPVGERAAVQAADVMPVVVATGLDNGVEEGRLGWTMAGRK